MRRAIHRLLGHVFNVSMWLTLFGAIAWAMTAWGYAVLFISGDSPDAWWMALPIIAVVTGCVLMFLSKFGQEFIEATLDYHS